ncbi:hypothetical protein JQ628_04210 [Bradyrhizobium lablabi]|uniref:hypothetical protein n=1 Tax=Bradyrhizobium lablabi TaxID=722472 RepID=UPI001BAB3867|nr:hypothetical protein [Bradyrhizobium lablabi]MBR1120709.1 hypothetical protein [Bradyrhizobium lablabi]
MSVIIRICVLVSASLLNFAVYAQTLEELPVAKDIPKAQTVPADGEFDVRGITLGMTYSEVEQVLQKLGSKDPQAQIYNLQIKDNKGNTAGFKLRQSLQGSAITGVDGARENLAVYFTTRLNEVRAYRVTRNLIYDSDATRANLADLISSIKKKYGQPSFEDLQTFPAQMSYVWFRGKRVAFPENDPRRRRASYGNEGTPEGCLRLSNYGLRYQFEERRNDQFDGCDAVMFFRVSSASNNRALVYSLDVEMVDKTRFMENARATDKWLMDEINRKASSQAPRTGPAL